MHKYEIFGNMKKATFFSVCFIVLMSLYSCKQKKEVVEPDPVMMEEMARLEAREDSIPGPDDYTDTIFGVPLEMVYVGRGFLQLGGKPERDGEKIFGDEIPVHVVEFSGYYISRYPVTQALWEAVMNYNPSEFQDNTMPVNNVSWDEATLFCFKLSLISGQPYALPTEAQWEYAARGGIRSRGTMYSGSNMLPLVGCCFQNSPCPVGQYKPNELGIYDMSGGVWEWCYDWFGEFSSDTVFNPTGPEYGFHKVLKGGSWCSDTLSCRIAHRSGASTNTKAPNVGFRVVMRTYARYKPKKN